MEKNKEKEEAKPVRKKDIYGKGRAPRLRGLWGRTGRKEAAFRASRSWRARQDSDGCTPTDQRTDSDGRGRGKGE